MPSQFLQSFTSPLLSSEVGDVQFMTDNDYADIIVTGGYVSDPVYEARLYPNDDGICTIYQLGDAITQWMIDCAFSFRTFTLKDKVSGESVQLSVLLCSRVSGAMINGYADVIRRPLLSLRFGLVRPDSFIHFYCIPKAAVAPEGMKVYVLVMGYDFEGKARKEALEYKASEKDGKIAECILDVDSILDDVNDLQDEGKEWECITALTLSNIQNDCTASYHVSDDQDLVGFMFRNSFGLFENIFLHAEVLPDISVEAESAVIGHRNVQYDVEHTQSFKVEASGIAEAEWPRVSQFLTSSEIYELVSGFQRRVFLSDISPEACRTYDSLGSLKFAYSYEDSRLTF